MPPLFYASLIVHFLTSITGIWKFRYISKPLKLMVWNICLTFIGTSIERIMGMYHIHNLWVINISGFIETIILLFVFFLCQKIKVQGYIIKAALFLYVLIWVIGKFTFEPITEFGDITDIISSSYQIVFGVVLLIQVLGDNSVAWKNDGRFWLTIGIILYAASTIFLFGMFNNLLVSSIELLKKIWPWNWIMIIVSHLFFLRAFLCKPEIQAGTQNKAEM
jgi:hypothetical protein